MNNMMYQQPQMPMGYPNYQQPNYQYGGIRRPIHGNNPLTEEQKKLLQTKGNRLNLGLSDLDIARGTCTHKNGDQICLYKPNPNSNRVRCSLCDEEFEEVQGSQEAIQGAVDLILNIFNTAKTFWLNVPNDVALNYFPIFELVKRLPKVFEIASRDFSSAEQQYNLQPGANPYGFAMLNNLMSPQMAYGYNPAMQQYGQPMGQPMPQQPMQQPMYGQPMGQPYPVNVPMQGTPAYGGAVNPFGYNAMPAVDNTAAAPTQAAQPAQPTAPAPTEAVNQKVFNV